MKRQKLHPVQILLTLALLGTFSCQSRGGSSSSVEKSAEYDTLRIAKRNHLDGDSTKPYCDIRVEFVYPVSSVGLDADSLQHVFIRYMFGASYANRPPHEAVEAYINNYIENYNYDAGTYRESVDDMMALNELIPGIDLNDSEHRVDEDFYSYYETLANSIQYNSHGIISFQVEQSNNRGGATSYVSYRNYVIDVHSGLQITEYDLFRAGYDQALQHLIITSLLEQNNVKTVEELEDLGFFGVREIIPNENFLLTQQGIIYTYNKGEYSAYPLDAPQVIIPYSAIRSLLREKTVAAKLADL